MIMERKMIKTKVIAMPKKNRKGQKIPLEKAATLFWGKSQGEKLKAGRERKGLSMEKLSALLEECGISCKPSNIVNLEKGDAQTIKTKTLLVLISLLDMDIKDF